MSSASKPLKRAKRRTDVAVGSNLKAFMQAAGINERELAYALQVKTGTIVAYCTGRARMNPDTITRIANTLSIPVTALFASRSHATSLH